MMSQILLRWAFDFVYQLNIKIHKKISVQQNIDDATITYIIKANH